MHIRALDGIRGLAILLVVLFHYGFAPFGWIGVQIFFVLSGYLITSILLSTKELSIGSYLRRFYWRRSLRILPLYFAVLLAALAVYWKWQVPSQFLEDLPYLATYTTNFGRLRPQDIDPTFVHLWSLAVEEQFYLLWPVLIYAAPQRQLKKTVAIIILGAPLIRLAIYFHFRDDPAVVGRAIYVLPLTQFDAFAFGAAISLWDLRKVANASFLFAIAAVTMCALGAATILYMHFVGGGAPKGSLGFTMYLMPLHGFVWGYSLIDIVSMLGIVCALQRISAFRSLENSILVYIGKISYGIYVFHVPVLVILNSLGADHFVIYTTAVLLISAASFRWLEAPFLKLK